MFTGDNLILNDMLVLLIPNKERKLSKKVKEKKFEYRAYKYKIFVITCLKDYISRWIPELDSMQLIITTKKSYRGSSIDTMQR